MKRMLLAATLMAGVSGSVHTVAAQTNPLVGKWRIEYERGRRIENGAPTSIMGTATMTIEARADSMVATLESAPRPDGTAVPPATFGGRVTTEGGVFVQKASVTVNMDGEQRSSEVTMTWTLSVGGDTLGGTLLRVLPTMPEPPSPTPVKGARVKSG